MEKIECPKCNSIMQEFDIKPKKASKYEDCIRRCIQCQIGASNAQVNPTLIYKDYRNNIPSNLLEHLDETLEKTLNTTNRENKKIKLKNKGSRELLFTPFCLYM